MSLDCKLTWVGETSNIIETTTSNPTQTTTSNTAEVNNELNEPGEIFQPLNAFFTNTWGYQKGLESEKTKNKQTLRFVVKQVEQLYAGDIQIKQKENSVAFKGVLLDNQANAEQTIIFCSFRNVKPIKPNRDTTITFKPNKDKTIISGSASTKKTTKPKKPPNK